MIDEYGVFQVTPQKEFTQSGSAALGIQEHQVSLSPVQRPNVTV